ncbi:MAG: transcription termination/antitermination NusG family protein [Armatimonadota bacterium]|nr:transcription termination/antitermination NusG family protein [Armatimonadota bacterium]MDR7438220.1 transcription termination/antitermination NusG family protein [Armatimonadota bacterium]MDR7471917.1 transcription termination/antitermination NusG family protein [Armatimonadota bacterium]MDR7508166.1 transcription termination/antitermination NusG family protein [Armatimonadota bacterium]MDR7510360.1 transcription termination/antitermination NusG family protein [Armatimonadota bacterium]
MSGPEAVVSPLPAMSTADEQAVSAGAWWCEDPRWYVLQTKPRQEDRVSAFLHLRAPSVEVFLPRIEVVRRHAGRRYTVVEPLFPSYLFLWTPLTPATWDAVRWTPGALRILGDGERPVEVPEEMVQVIQDRVRPLGFVRVGLDLRPGERVRIRTGPFAGLEAIFERPTSRRDRVRVLLQLLGTLTPLEIDPLDLERL